MSWFKAPGLQNALKQAQKRIDTMLDIQDQLGSGGVGVGMGDELFTQSYEQTRPSSVSSATAANVPTTGPTALPSDKGARRKSDDGQDFWAGWLTKDSKEMVNSLTASAFFTGGSTVQTKQPTVAKTSTKNKQKTSRSVSKSHSKLKPETDAITQSPKSSMPQSLSQDDSASTLPATDPLFETFIGQQPLPLSLSAAADDSSVLAEQLAISSVSQSPMSSSVMQEDNGNVEPAITVGQQAISSALPEQLLSVEADDKTTTDSTEGPSVKPIEAATNDDTADEIQTCPDQSSHPETEPVVPPNLNEKETTESSEELAISTDESPVEVSQHELTSRTPETAGQVGDEVDGSNSKRETTESPTHSSSNSSGLVRIDKSDLNFNDEALEVHTNFSSDIEVLSVPTSTNENSNHTTPHSRAMLSMQTPNFPIHDIFGGRHQVEHVNTGDDDAVHSNCSSEGGFAAVSTSDITSPREASHERFSEPLSGEDLPQIHVPAVRLAPNDDEAEQVSSATSAKSDATLTLESDAVEVGNSSSTSNSAGNGANRSSWSNSNSDDSEQTKMLLKKLAELAQKLEAREAQVLQLSIRNTELEETNNEMQEKNEQLSRNCADVDQLRAEFTGRLAEADRKVQQAARDRQQMQQMVANAQMPNAQLQQELAERQEIITQLQEEGEKLSKQQHNNTQLIRKLRKREEDLEKQFEAAAQKAEKYCSEVEALKLAAREKDVELKEIRELLTGQKQAFNQQVRETADLRAKLDEAEERIHGLQAALDRAHQEVDSQRRGKATAEGRAQEALMSAELQLKEQMKTVIDGMEQDKEKTIRQYELQLSDLRESLSNSQREAQRREDRIYAEMNDLRRQLETSERRNEDLSNSLSTATKPLLRQIASLQNSLSTQSDNSELAERAMTERLAVEQGKVTKASERERLAQDELANVRARLNVVDGEIASLRSDKMALQAQIDTERRIAKEKVEEQEKAFEARVERALADTDLVKKEKRALEADMQLRLDSALEENERLKEQLKESLERLAEQRRTPTPIASSIMSESRDSVQLTGALDDDLETSFTIVPAVSGSDPFTFDRTLTDWQNTEQLLSRLRQREGEISHLQKELKKQQQVRDSLTREMASMGEQMTWLTAERDRLASVEQQVADVNQRYENLLLMYGEKVEEVDELKLDLQDVKDMYRSQINELMRS